MPTAPKPEREPMPESTERTERVSEAKINGLCSVAVRALTPAAFDLLSGIVDELRAHRKREARANMLSPEECDHIMAQNNQLEAEVSRLTAQVEQRRHEQENLFSAARSVLRWHAENWVSTEQWARLRRCVADLESKKEKRDG